MHVDTHTHTHTARMGGGSALLSDTLRPVRHACHHALHACAIANVTTNVVDEEGDAMIHGKTVVSALETREPSRGTGNVMMNRETRIRLQKRRVGAAMQAMRLCAFELSSDDTLTGSFMVVNTHVGTAWLPCSTWRLSW
mmetsp:Transcript_21995/g.42789  ORF Transcript_21995/g.42789 Transcript_21995/m.42789 type:complete len:139 (+) Transcript_21995:3-419(+)